MLICIRLAATPHDAALAGMSVLLRVALRLMKSYSDKR
jgi:hypothetical protein